MGEIADLANAVGYALEGDWVNAGISAAGVIPVVGDLAKAGRVGKKVAQELVERGSGQAAKRQAKNAPQQQRPTSRQTTQARLTSLAAITRTLRKGDRLTTSSSKRRGKKDGRWRKSLSTLLRVRNAVQMQSPPKDIPLR